MRPLFAVGTGMAALAVIALPSSARADLKLCNRMSYVLDAALALENMGAVATRGWFRLAPGQCNTVLHGELIAERSYVHVRTLPLYGTAPLPLAGHDNFCVADKNFVIAAARRCRGVQRRARFTRIKPSQGDDGPVAYLAEEARYDDAQARLAGIQRLLAVAGYDASPIDGVNGPRTEAALAQFLRDRQLGAQTALAPDFFKTLIAAAQNPQGRGFAWCNDTHHTVMAALGFDGKDGVHTRGWYRLAPGRCVRPELRGETKRLYSYAAAIDGDGRQVRRGAGVLTWGGDTVLCTRASKFELTEQKDCAGRGLTAAGFAAVELGEKPATTVRFRE